jgi:hypothetical protein
MKKLSTPGLAACGGELGVTACSGYGRGCDSCTCGCVHLLSSNHEHNMRSVQRSQYWHCSDSREEVADTRGAQQAKQRVRAAPAVLAQARVLNVLSAQRNTS